MYFICEKGRIRIKIICSQAALIEDVRIVHDLKACVTPPGSERQLC